ncbi:MAG: hypothetical protein ABJA78_10395 [Ferruginibacter sp.]
MENLLKTGRAIFALGNLALGILCIYYKDFIIGRPPAWSEGSDLNPMLAYISGGLIIISAVLILINKKAGRASLLIAFLILALSVSRHLPVFINDWVNTYKAMGLMGGALITAASFFKLKRTWNDVLIISGSILLAAFFIAAGYAHFKYAAFVDGLIPGFIPFHSFWTYFCGVCLIAGGAGILIPFTRRWAALLSGIMVAGWFLLLHIPRFIADTSNRSDRLGLCESFTFAGIFFILAALLDQKRSAVRA